MEFVGLWIVTCALALLLDPMVEVAATRPRTSPLKVECGLKMYELNSTYAGYVERTKAFIKDEAPHHWPSGPGQSHRFPYQVEYIGQINYRAACTETATMKSQADCRTCLTKLTEVLGTKYCTRKYVAGIFSGDCFVRWQPWNTQYSKQIPPWEHYD